MQNQQPIGMLQQLQNAVSGSDRNASDRLAIALMSLSGASPSLQPMIAMANQGMQKRQTLEREQAATNKSLEYLQKAAQTDPLAAQFLQAAGSIGAGQAATQYLNVKMQDRNRKLSARPQTSYNLLAPEEIAAAGLPVGTVAQRSSTGQVQILQSPQGGDDGTAFIQDINYLKTLFPEASNEQLLKLKNSRDASSPSIVNFKATTRPVTINGVTHEIGSVFSIDKNNAKDVASALDQLAIKVLPSQQITTLPPNGGLDTSALADEAVRNASQTITDPIEIGDAAGGDIPGKVTDALNFVYGQFTGEFSSARAKQVAQVNAGNNSIKEPLVKALNARGSNYTQQTIEKILPLPTDSNEKYIDKAEALIPTLRGILEVRIAERDSATNLIEKTQAETDIQSLADWIVRHEFGISAYRKSKTGGVSSIEAQADAILDGR